MNLKEFIKPSAFKILASLSIGVLYLYFAVEDVCAVSLFFAFCYKAYGFPFTYLVTGDIDRAIGHIKTLPFGSYFLKSGNHLLNLVALAMDLALIYLLACVMAMMLSNAEVKRHL